MNGAAQPPAKRLTADQLTRFRNLYAGQWAGSWSEEGGRRGTADLAAALDVARRVGTYTLAFTGPLFGGPPPATITYVIPVDQFDASSESASAQTPQLGTVALVVQGFGKVTLHATDIPGHADIDSIDLTASADTPVTVSVSYTITHRSGQIERGALAAAKGTTRPPVPSPSQASSLTDFTGGAYAARLVTATELTQALGEPVPAPHANGGKVGYAPGINVSNAAATAASGDVFVQYSIYRGADIAAITAYWHDYDYEPLVPGLGDMARAHINQPGQPYFELYVLKGLQVLSLQVSFTGNTKSGGQIDGIYLAVAQAIAARMGA